MHDPSPQDDRLSFLYIIIGYGGMPYYVNMCTEQSCKAVIIYDEGDMLGMSGNCTCNIHTLYTVAYTSLLTLAQDKVLVRPIDH